MRLTFSTQHRQSLADINRAAERLFEAQRQVGTGKRVHKPSDDPSAAAAAGLERGRLADIDRYSQAADSATARLLVADNVLSDLVRQVSSARTTALSARGTVVTDSQREAIAQQLEGLRDGVLQNVNVSFRGTYLFGGAAGTTRPYTKDSSGVVSAYQGSTVETSVDVDEVVDVTTAFNGEALAKGSATDDLFTVLDRVIDAVRAGNEAGIAAADADLDVAFERVTAVQSRVGATLRAAEDAKLRSVTAAQGTEARLASLEDANMAAAVSNMTQADTIYRAALGAAAQLQRQSLMDYLR